LISAFKAIQRKLTMNCLLAVMTIQSAQRPLLLCAVDLQLSIPSQIVCDNLMPGMNSTNYG
jgi:hypothetical protein